MKDLRETALAVKAASAELGLLSAEKRNAALSAIADALIAHEADILAANELDIADGRANGMSESLLDRLALTGARIEGMAEGVRQLIALPDPLGEVIEEFTRPNGLRIRKVRVPLGVIGMIYEARPNVTVDTAAIALKTGNGILLRGSASALRSNLALANVMRGALRSVGLPEDALAVVEDTAHESVDRMICMNDCVDVVIPRGGAGLIRRVVQTATVPVLETGVGNCHIYLDESADYDMAEAIVVNAKIQRPSVCNAMETLLVHSVWATAHLAKLLAKLHTLGVTIHGDAQVRAVDKLALPAGEEDWANEYLAPELAVKVVDSLEEAMQHIARYGTKHTEAIITEDAENARIFLRCVDAAAVNHNASTRFTDGFEFGFGAEMGISTQKLHARGPLGLREMTSYKYLVYGNGQVRQ